MSLPSSSSSPISHSSPRETICCVTRATAQDKWLFCENWRGQDQGETPINMFYTSLSAKVPCFLYIITERAIGIFSPQLLNDETCIGWYILKQLSVHKPLSSDRKTAWSLQSQQTSQEQMNRIKNYRWRDEGATILHLISDFQSMFDFCRQENYRQCHIRASPSFIVFFFFLHFDYFYRAFLTGVIRTLWDLNPHNKTINCLTVAVIVKLFMLDILHTWHRNSSINSFIAIITIISNNHYEVVLWVQ